MEVWREKFNAYKARFAALSLRTRVASLTGAGLLIAVLILGINYGSQPNFTLLFSSLSQQDAARIVERLQGLNIPYELGSAGTSILVPEESVHETRLVLAGEGLPSGGGVGFELFDQQRFGESDFSEQVQFRRALEGELARTITSISGVSSARVHLVMPERTLFASEHRGASASVALRLQPGWQLGEQQVNGIAHLVASAVPGLDLNAVTVIDGDGRPLAGTTHGEEEQAAGSQDLRSEIERTKQRAIEELLSASLGAGAAVVQVSAEVNMSREETLQESYDPEATATRSFEITQEGSSSETGAAAGVPGAASNLPGGAPAEGSQGTTGDSRRTERRNFEVTKMVRRAFHPVGRVTRLHVAVLIDGHWTGEGDERVFSPRDEAELAQIRELVSGAAGLDEERGDSVTVQCMPFASSTDAPVVYEPTALELYGPYLPYAVAALVLLVLLILAVLWMRRQKNTPKESEKRELSQLAMPQSIAGLTAGDPDGEEDLALPGPADETLADYEQLRTLALEVARRDPELAARVVRGWLEDDMRVEAEENAESEAA